MREGLRLFWRCWFSLVLCADMISVSGKVFTILAIQTLSLNGFVLREAYTFTQSYPVIPYAMKHFNERDGSVLPFLSHIKCNSTLRLRNGVIHDDQYKPNVATRILFQAVSEGNTIDFMLGPSIDDSALLILGMAAGSLGIPLMAHLSDSSAESDKSVYPTTFRIFPANDQTAIAVVNMISRLGVSTLGLLFSNDGAGNNIRSLVAAACAEMNMTLVAYSYQASLTGAALDQSYEAAFRPIVNQGVNYIFHENTGVLQEVSFARAATRLNWVKNKVYITALPTSLSNIMAYAARINETAMMTQFYKGTLTLTLDTENPKPPGFERLNDAFQGFNASYANDHFPKGKTDSNQSYGFSQEFFNQNISLYAAAGYDAVIALALATCNASSNNLLENLKAVEFEGTTGPIGFNSELNRNFLGGLAILLYNIQEDSNGNLEQNYIGAYSNNQWSIATPIIFNDGTTNPPPDLVRSPPVIDQLSTGIQILGFLEAAIGIFLCGCAMYVVILGNKVKERFPDDLDRFFTVIAICGSILISSSIIPTSVETDAGCMGFIWLFTLGFTVVTASFTAKSVLIWRDWEYQNQGPREPINSLFCPISLQHFRCKRLEAWKSANLSRKSDRATLPRSRSVAVEIAIVITVLTMTSLLLAFQFTGPLRIVVVTQVADPAGHPLNQARICDGVGGGNHVLSGFNVAIFTLLGVLASITLLAVLFTRNAPRPFSTEATAICYASLSIFQIYFVALSTVIAVWETSLARFLVESSVAFVISLLVTGVLVGSRFLSCRSTHSHSSTRGPQLRGNENERVNLTHDTNDLSRTLHRIRPVQDLQPSGIIASSTSVLLHQSKHDAIEMTSSKLLEQSLTQLENAEISSQIKLGEVSSAMIPPVKKKVPGFVDPSSFQVLYHPEMNGSATSHLPRPHQLFQVGISPFSSSHVEQIYGPDWAQSDSHARNTPDDPCPSPKLSANILAIS